MKIRHRSPHHRDAREAAPERRHRAALIATRSSCSSATILSAQSTDARVNLVTPALVQALSRRARAGEGDRGGARAADRLHRVLPSEVEGADRHGADARRRARRRGARRHGQADRAAGRRPQDGERRPRPRARRARASVDRHVLRVSNRIGIAVERRSGRGRAPAHARRFHPAMWTLASDVQILHGRRICRPKPLCDQCSVRKDCDYYRASEAEA